MGAIATVRLVPASLETKSKSGTQPTTDRYIAGTGLPLGIGSAILPCACWEGQCPRGGAGKDWSFDLESERECDRLLDTKRLMPRAKQSRSVHPASIATPNRYLSAPRS